LFIVFGIRYTTLRLLIYVELEILNSSEGKKTILYQINKGVFLIGISMNHNIL